MAGGVSMRAVSGFLANRFLTIKNSFFTLSKKKI